MFDVWSFLPQNVMDCSKLTGITPPPPSFLPSPPLNLQTVQAPFWAIPPLYWFFENPKNKFFIINPILSFKSN